MPGSRQQLLDSSDDELRLEWLGEHAIAPGRRSLRLIDRLERAGEEHDRNVREAGRLFDVPGYFVPVPARHADVGQHDVGRRLVEDGDRFVAIAHGHDVDVLIGKGQLDHALDRDAVVGEEQGTRHRRSYRTITAVQLGAGR